MGTTIIFGVVAMMLLLDIHIDDLKFPQRFIFIAGNLLTLLVNMILILFLPPGTQMKFYVLLVHIPLILIFYFTTNTPLIKLIFALFTTVFIIYPGNMILNIVNRTTNLVYPSFAYCLIYITVCAGILLVVYRFFKPNFNYLIKNYNGMSFLKLCLLPLAYNISNYWLGLYLFTYSITTNLFYIRILIFVITLTAYILILDIAKSSREKEALQGAQMALALQLESANQQLAALQTTQEQSAIYRHDMRHHFSMIIGYLADGDNRKAEKYIRRAQADIDEITPARYCQNNAVNLILSFFEAKAKKLGVSFSVDADLPQTLPIPETELCTLLSNGLENAIVAASQVPEGQFRKVRVSCQTHKRNLLILIENNFTGEVVIQEGLPQSLREGHGFGVRSMTMIAEKYKGLCSFEAKGEIFTLRIALQFNSQPA